MKDYYGSDKAESVNDKLSLRGKNGTKNLVYCGIFTALIAIGAFIQVPIPALPFTLQTFFVMLAGLLLGAKKGFLSTLVYLLLGLFGVPIFTAGGGFWYIFKPSFGYIIGFCIAAYLIGKITEDMKEHTIKKLFISNLLGLGVIYAIGLAYYYMICNCVIDTPIAFLPLFLNCFLLLIPGDLCLAVLAAVLGKRLIPMFKRNNSVFG